MDNFTKLSQKIHLGPFWTLSTHFIPFLGHKKEGQKCQHYFVLMFLKFLIFFNINGSQKITIWWIGWFDWLKAFEPFKLENYSYVSRYAAWFCTILAPPSVFSASNRSCSMSVWYVCPSIFLMSKCAFVYYVFFVNLNFQNLHLIMWDIFQNVENMCIPHRICFEMSTIPPGTHACW